MAVSASHSHRILQICFWRFKILLPPKCKPFLPRLVVILEFKNCCKISDDSFLKIYLFVALPCRVCAAARAFSGCGGWELLFGCGAWVSCCCGFSCCRALSLGCSGLSSCSTWTQQLRLLRSRGQTQQQGFIALGHVESSTNGDRTLVPCIGRWTPNHQTMREA